MARASAIDLRRASRPTAADAVVALVDTFERLRASHAELLGIFDGLTANVPEEFQILDRARVIAAEALCSDCPPAGYPTDITRCNPCPHRKSPTERPAPKV
jgi:hypothetical protein